MNARGSMRQAVGFIALLLLALALVLPAGRDATGSVMLFGGAIGAGLLVLAAVTVGVAMRLPVGLAGALLPTLGMLVALAAPLALLGRAGLELGLDAPALWCASLGLGAAGWYALERWCSLPSYLAGPHKAGKFLVPALFGLGVLFQWEVIVRGFGVPKVLLPAPSLIALALQAQAGVLWADFQQTFMKSVLAGYAIGCGSGLAVAILIERSPFLQRGLLPLGSLVSAIPIVGIAPIMVMWFGFDWPSKAAVIVVMTFFPMLISTLAGLAAADHMQRDLMRSYGAGYGQTLVKLRLPAALPHIFNALKINSTLALIGAIVAEFFGTPIVGMGFRISTEVARMNVDVVWATIAVAALAGSVFYGLVAVIERLLTFWHPSFR